MPEIDGFPYSVASSAQRPDGGDGWAPAGTVHAVPSGGLQTMCGLAVDGLLAFTSLDFDAGRRPRCPRCVLGQHLAAR